MLDRTQFSIRSKDIRRKVNLLEGLHKTCQLTELGLQEPILNEMRYLSRALADMLHHQDNEDLTEAGKALATAELAVHSAINDAVDILVTYTKTTLAKLARDYKTFQIAASDFSDEHLKTLRAMQKVNGHIVTSREHRETRLEIYEALALPENSEALKQIAAFALKFSEIEALAQAVHLSTLEDKVNDEFLVAEMRKAIGRKNTAESFFHVFLQPKFHYEEGRRVLIGAEALLRFKNFEHNCSPGVFIPVAERNHLIAPIGRMVLEMTLDLLKAHPEIPCISVNVSTYELASHSYSAEVLELVEASGIEAGRLELEITERAVIVDKASEKHLLELANKGIKISIDDFGTGETRFDYLAKFPVHVIKIDMSLVRNFEAAPMSYEKLLQAICAVGKSCNMDIVAEGIESIEVANALVSLGINKFQGFYFGKPVSVAQFLDDHTVHLKP